MITTILNLNFQVTSHAIEDATLAFVLPNILYVINHFEFQILTPS
jgi:hypothetical protein